MCLVGDRIEHFVCVDHHCAVNRRVGFQQPVVVATALAQPVATLVHAECRDDDEIDAGLRKGIYRRGGGFRNVVLAGCHVVIIDVFRPGKLSLGKRQREEHGEPGLLQRGDEVLSAWFSRSGVVSGNVGRSAASDFLGHVASQSLIFERCMVRVGALLSLCEKTLPAFSLCFHILHFRHAEGHLVEDTGEEISSVLLMTLSISDHKHAVKTVIVPAAGMGTRFLPATKTVPKELLPVVDTPGIELIAEEAAALGASRLAVVTSPNKKEVLDHFRPHETLERTLEERGKTAQLAKVRRAPEIIEAIAVEQDKPLGLGHAVACAESALDDDEDVVAVMLPDDLVLPMGVMEKMAEVRSRFGGSVLCAFDVPRDEVSNYGVFDVEECPMEDVARVKTMVEKPAVEDAPSTLAATGRYLLDRKIFDALRRITPGKGGELQLTDAIELLIEEGEPVHVLVHRGTRHDLGNPGGYIKACVDFGLQHPVYGPGIRRFLEELLG